MQITAHQWRVMLEALQQMQDEQGKILEEVKALRAELKQAGYACALVAGLVLIGGYLLLITWGGEGGTPPATAPWVYARTLHRCTTDLSGPRETLSVYG